MACVDATPPFVDAPESPWPDATEEPTPTPTRTLHASRAVGSSAAFFPPADALKPPAGPAAAAPVALTAAAIASLDPFGAAKARVPDSRDEPEAMMSHGESPPAGAAAYFASVRVARRGNSGLGNAGLGNHGLDSGASAVSSAAPSPAPFPSTALARATLRGGYGHATPGGSTVGSRPASSVGSSLAGSSLTSDSASGRGMPLPGMPAQGMAGQGHGWHDRAGVGRSLTPQPHRPGGGGAMARGSSTPLLCTPEPEPPLAPAGAALGGSLPGQAASIREATGVEMSNGAAGAHERARRRRAELEKSRWTEEARSGDGGGLAQGMNPGGGGKPAEKGEKMDKGDKGDKGKAAVPEGYRIFCEAFRRSTAQRVRDAIAFGDLPPDHGLESQNHGLESVTRVHGAGVVA